MPKKFGNATGQLQILHNPYQQAFWRALAARNPDGTRQFYRLALFSGRRGGKTLGGAIGLAKEAGKPLRRPDDPRPPVYWACAPSYEELRDYVLPAMQLVIPSGWVEDWRETNLELTLTNGSIIQFRSLDDPERARGPGLHGAWLDEARKLQHRAWTTLRPALTEHRGFAIFTTSPAGPLHWTFRELWKKALDGEPGWWAAKYRSADNPYLPPEEIESARGDMDAQFYRQEYLADFVHFTGSIYGDLIVPRVLRTDEAIRELIPEWPQIDESRPRLCGIDPGTDHPFGGVLFIVTARGLVGTGEYLAAGKSFADHIEGLRKMWGKQPPTHVCYDRTSPQTALELREYGIFATPSESETQAGIRRVQTLLRRGQLWFIEQLMPKTIEQLHSLHWAENTTKSGERLQERQFKFDDDLADPVRYVCMTFPQFFDPPKDMQSGRDLSALPATTQAEIRRERASTERLYSGRPDEMLDEADLEPYDPFGSEAEAEGGSPWMDWCT